MYARSIGPALPCGMGSHMPPPGSASWLHTVQSTPSTPAELYTHPAKVASTTPSQVDGPPGSDFSWQLDTPPKHAPQASRQAPLRPPPLVAQLSRERDRAVAPRRWHHAPRTTRHQVGVPGSHLMFRDLLCSQLRDPEVRSAAPHCRAFGPTSLRLREPSPVYAACTAVHIASRSPRAESRGAELVSNSWN
jgi:hypothetical protein